MTHHCRHCAQPIPYADVQDMQAPYRGMVHAIAAYEASINPAGEMTDLRRELHRIADQQPAAARTFALATTRYDRPLDEAAPHIMETDCG